jgi:excisionase family DNA binding protein
MRGVEWERLKASESSSCLRAVEYPAGRERLLTAKQVAELLQVPLSWVYSRTSSRAADRIPGFRLGKYWRFREGDVLDWLETRRQYPLVDSND